MFGLIGTNGQYFFELRNRKILPLNFISDFYTEIPKTQVTGYFGSQTQNAVLSFQKLFGIPENGTVGAVTWNEITELYRDLYLGSRLNDGQYPGYEIGI